MAVFLMDRRRPDLRARCAATGSECHFQPSMRGKTRRNRAMQLEQQVGQLQSELEFVRSGQTAAGGSADDQAARSQDLSSASEDDEEEDDGFDP